MLSKYEPWHLFPVPPQMASSMRQALYPSGAKDDPRDADLLLDILLNLTYAQNSAPSQAAESLDRDKPRVTGNNIPSLRLVSRVTCSQSLLPSMAAV